MMKIFISGPMDGYDDHNYATFKTKAYEYRRLGWKVFNPGEIDFTTYAEAMKTCLAHICDEKPTVYFLCGWEHSPGSRTEHALATALQLKMMYQST